MLTQSFNLTNIGKKLIGKCIENNNNGLAIWELQWDVLKHTTLQFLVLTGEKSFQFTRKPNCHITTKLQAICKKIGKRTYS